MRSPCLARTLLLVLFIHSTWCQRQGNTGRYGDNDVLAGEASTASPQPPKKNLNHMYVRLPRLDTKDKLTLWIMRHSLSMKARATCSSEIRDTLLSLEIELEEIKDLLKEQTASLKTLSRGQAKLWADRNRQRRRHVQTKKMLKGLQRSCTCQARRATKYLQGDGDKDDGLFKDQPFSPVSPHTSPATSTRSSSGTDGSIQSTTLHALGMLARSDDEGNGGDSMVVVDEEAATVEVNLTSGVVRGNQTGMRWTVPLRKGKADTCSFQGVLMTTFTPPDAGQVRSRLQIDLWMEEPEEWVFNLGDSEANDGKSGDGSLQENDSEVEVKDAGLYVYASDRAADPLRKLLFGAEEFLKGRLTLTVSDGKLAWDNHNGVQRNLTLSTLFALAGQPDRQGPVNYDLFLGLNRVVAGRYREGHGLCFLTAKWV